MIDKYSSIVTNSRNLQKMQINQYMLSFIKKVMIKSTKPKQKKKTTKIKQQKQIHQNKASTEFNRIFSELQSKYHIKFEDIFLVT